MQGQRKNLDAYPNAVDCEQDESIDDPYGFINQSASRSEMNLQSSLRPDMMDYAGVDQDVRMLRGKGTSEPSSSSKAKTVVSDDGFKMEQGWPYASRTGAGSSSRSEVEFERSRMSIPTTSSVGHNVYSKSSHYACMPQARSTFIAHHTDQFPESNRKHWQALRENMFTNLIDEYKEVATDPITPAAYFNNFGSSAGTSGYALEEFDGSGSSIGCWGQSSKRKLHEGSSSQSYPTGTSGNVTQNQNSLNNGRPSNSVFDAINFPLNPLLPINGSAGSQFDDNFHLHTDEDAADCNLRNFYSGRNLRHPHDSVSFDSSFDENARQSNVPVEESYSEPRHYIGSMRLGSTAVVRPSSRSPRIDHEGMYISHTSSGAHTLRHSGNSITRLGDSLTLRNFNSNMGLVSQDEDHAILSTREPRNLGQDPTNWSLATRPDIPTTSSSSTRTRTSHVSRPLSAPPPWIHPQNTPQTNQRFPGFAPWTLFPSYDTEIRNPSSHSPPLSLMSFTSEAVSSRPSSHNVLQAHRRLGSMPERQDDAIWLPHREMAADMEARRLLFSEICHVLGGARRGENLQIEDYMLFDPIIYHGLAEIHDRHRDMRLDVDNMSYEELLALEERIGDVNTGLSEEIIRKTMKQHKYVQETAMTAAAQDVEPCCVCQEEFLAGEELGKLDCGHDFHVNCIKQWLMLKNICPICKIMGLAT